MNSAVVGWPREISVDSRVFEVCCVQGLAGVERFANDIDRLNMAACSPNPFLSSAFLRMYCRQCEYHEPDEGERLYLVREGARLIGCAPMRKVRDGRCGALRMLRWGSDRLCLMAAADTEHPGMLSAPADGDPVARAVIHYLCEFEPGWDMLEFAGQPPDGDLVRALCAAQGARFRVRRCPVQPCNDIELGWKDLHGYFRSLSKKMRSNISRQARRLFAAGAVELIVAEGGPATGAWFDAYCELDRRSWKDGTHASIRRSPRRVSFFRELAQGRGGLEPAFIGIVLDGVLIAGLIMGAQSPSPALRHGAWCLEMAYDQSRSGLGPAQLLLLLAMKCAMERGHSHLSFMQNFSRFKHRWGARQVEVVDVSLIRRATLRNLAIVLRDAFRGGKSVAGPEDRAAAGRGGGPCTVLDASSPPVNLEPARVLTAEALAATRHMVRRLDARAAGTCLPFSVQ